MKHELGFRSRIWFCEISGLELLKNSSKILQEDECLNKNEVGIFKNELYQKGINELIYGGDKPYKHLSTHILQSSENTLLKKLFLMSSFKIEE